MSLSITSTYAGEFAGKYVSAALIELVILLQTD